VRLRNLSPPALDFDDPATREKALTLRLRIKSPLAQRASGGVFRPYLASKSFN
jgi:hypothetical protein